MNSKTKTTAIKVAASQRKRCTAGENTAAVIAKSGGKVLGSVRPPLATPDLSSFVLQAQASKAKIIGIAGGPPNNMNEIKTGAEFGIFKGGQQMAALLALITDIHSLGLPAAQGLLLTTSFYWDMDDKTRAWAKRFYAKLNKMPTMWQAGVYSSVMHYLNAVKASGTDAPLAVAAKMRATPVDDMYTQGARIGANLNAAARPRTDLAIGTGLTLQATNFW